MLYDKLATKTEDAYSRDHLKAMAAESMDRATSVGHLPPTLLHSRGSLALDEGKFEEALAYFEKAIAANREIKAQAEVSGKVLQVDGIDESFTFNQIGNVYFNLGLNEKAIDAFQRGLEVDPSLMALHVNLGIVTRSVLGDVAARVVYHR